MKKAIVITSIITATMVSYGQSLDVRKPPVDEDGKVWVYRDGATANPQIFVPYAWMPEQAGQMMVIQTESTASPHTGVRNTSGMDRCISVDITWRSPFWVGCAFISGPDSPPWWGEDNRGWYYDLSKLRNKKLVFYARGEMGGERIKAKVGILGDKSFGDSLRFAKETPWLKLTTSWEKYELDLSRVKDSDLERICNGFTFVLDKAQQTGMPRNTTFFLDTIYFE